MPRDHYVAQTYLKHFLLPGGGGLLRGYRKSNLSNFPCRPADICHELGGDIVPEFLSEPKALGEFRKTFEPHWNQALGELLDRKASRDVKLAIAGYAANLLGATPAMKRLTMESHNQSVVETVRAYETLRARRGKADPRLLEAIEMIDAGKLAVETEPNWARAMNASHLEGFAWSLYNADWIVVANLTPVDFLTSDNPFAFDDPGPFRGGPARMTRYLPLTRRFCLCVETDASEKPGPIDFTKPPGGRVRFATTDRVDGVAHINELVVQCAEDLVLASAKIDALEAVVAKYAKHRVSNEFISIVQRDGFLQGLRLRVCDPATNRSKWSWPPVAA